VGSRAEQSGVQRGEGRGGSGGRLALRSHDLALVRRQALAFLFPGFALLGSWGVGLAIRHLQ
jgi:hypothetical protein